MTKLPERIASGEVEAPDVFCGGTPCFTAGHMVLTASGYRAIESLALGEEVITHKGRLRKILRFGSKVAKVGHLSAVGLPDGIVCTEEHPFLSSYWRNQSTRRNKVYTKVETCSEPEWVAAKDLPGRQWCALSQVEPTACKPDSRLFDERTAMYVAGMYLGDGWLRCWAGRRKRAVMLGINEIKYQKLLAVIGQAGHSISRERTGIKVCFGDTAFANWLDANFGRGSHMKTLPAWVMGHPHRDALLQGYIDTDGCVDDGKVTINSTSKSLAHGVCDLLNIQGWSTSIAKVEKADTCVIEERTVNQRDYFQVRANHLSISRKSRVCHGYLMRTVQAWKPAGEEMVFNIEVEEDNSFILAGAVVHNCQAFSVAGLRKSLDDARGNLSLTFCEIANAIDTTRLLRGDQPATIFWENVPGVLNTSDNAFGCFLAGLAGEADPLIPPGGKWSNAGAVLGPQRAVAWRVLDAQYFGVAQRRRRVFVVASARDGFDPAAVLFEFDGMRRDSAPSRETGEATTHATAPCLTSSGRGVERTGDTRGQDPVVAVHQPYTVANCLTARMHKGINSTLDEGQTPVVTHSLRGEGFDASEDGTGRGTPLVPVCHVDTMPTLRAGAPNGGAGHGARSGDSKDEYIVPVAFVQNSRDEVRLMGGDGSLVGALADETGAKQQCYVAAPVAVSLRGREGGATAELGDEVGNCLRASQGGGDKPHVLCDSLYNQGFNHARLYASPQKTHAGEILRTLREAIGEEAFAKWGLGILDSLQSPEILRQALHGLSIRPAPFSRSWVVHCALSRPEDGSGWLLQSLREAGCEGCPPQGWEPLEQLNGELRAYLQELSQPGAQAARFMLDLWQASEGVGLLREALSAIQKVGRPAYGQRKPVHTSSEGVRDSGAEGLQGSGLHGEVPREGVLQQARATGSERNIGASTDEQGASRNGALEQTMMVRRLTCEEAEFLQGFPRGYTAIPWRKKPASECPDGPRYKALGNSWAVPNISWIGRRIDAHLRALSGAETQPLRG